MTKTITEKVIKPCFKNYGKTQSEQISQMWEGIEQKK
jgi:hypothetical protein